MSKKNCKTVNTEKNGRNKQGRFTKGNPGKPANIKHNTTKIKMAFFQAFEDIGGVEALTAWATQNKNKKEFYKILTSILPKDLDITMPDETLKAWEDIKADALVGAAQKLAAEIGEITGIKVCNQKTEGNKPT